ncbi:MAG: hypothetical protein ABFS19_10155 [Thermodesulfobacteriota bacterium]
MDHKREELKQLMAQRTYRDNSHFRTPAKIVDSYFDFFQISLKHQGIELAGSLLYEEIKDLDICALGGPGHAGTSVICRAAFLKKIGVFYVRDCMRKEGEVTEPRYLESRIKNGDRVALVADVISSGSRLLTAIEEVFQFGGIIAKIIIFIDSLDGEGVDRVKNFIETNRLDTEIKVLYTAKEVLG